MPAMFQYSQASDSSEQVRHYDDISFTYCCIAYARIPFIGISSICVE